MHRVCAVAPYYVSFFRWFLQVLSLFFLFCFSSFLFRYSVMFVSSFFIFFVHFQKFVVAGSDMLGGFSCMMSCIPRIASTVRGRVLLLLCTHIYVLISCNLPTTVCNLLHVSFHPPTVLSDTCNMYHYVVRCIPKSYLLL